MEFKTDKKNKKLVYLNQEIAKMLGKRTQFEITIRAIEALFDYANGIRQAAGINNSQLSQKAQNGLQYVQGLDQIIQQIRTLKQSIDLELDSIDQEPEVIEDPIEQPPASPQNGEVVS